MKYSARGLFWETAILRQAFVELVKGISSEENFNPGKSKNIFKMRRISMSEEGPLPSEAASMAVNYSSCLLMIS